MSKVEMFLRRFTYKTKAPCLWWMMSNRICCYNHCRVGTEDKGLCDSTSKVHGHEVSDGTRQGFAFIFISDWSTTQNRRKFRTWVLNFSTYYNINH